MSRMGQLEHWECMSRMGIHEQNGNAWAKWDCMSRMEKKAGAEFGSRSRIVKKTGAEWGSRNQEQNGKPGAEWGTRSGILCRMGKGAGIEWETMDAVNNGF